MSVFGITWDNCECVDNGVDNTSVNVEKKKSSEMQQLHLLQ